MSKSKGKRFVLPKPSNNEDLNTDFSSRLEYYDDEKRGILNIVRIKPRPTRKTATKSAYKTASKTASKSASKTASKSATKSASKSATKSASKTATKPATKIPKSARVMSRT